MRLLSFFMLLLLQYSCSRRSDFYLNKNTEPVLYSKFSHSTESYYYDTLKYRNEKSIFHFGIDDEAGTATLTANSSKRSDVIEITNNETLTITVKETGDALITCEAVNVFEKKMEFKIYMHTFINLPPITIADVRAIPTGLSAFEIEIDASKSYDLDAKFGGGIVKYNYKINNNYDVETTLSKIRYIFDSGGQKRILVRVQDNDGVWSEFVELYLSI
jgi:hypothetical protein